MVQTEANILQTPDVVEVEALVARISTSPQLSSSPKLREFLRYIVDCALRDAPQDATEQQIGIHVFARRPGYNSGDDSIVRSQARLLRMKLAAYFSAEGIDEPIRIEIPKGHYLPVFRPAAHPPEHHLDLQDTDPDFAPANLHPDLAPPDSSVLHGTPALSGASGQLNSSGYAAGALHPVTESLAPRLPAGQDHDTSGTPTFAAPPQKAGSSNADPAALLTSTSAAGPASIRTARAHLRPWPVAAALILLLALAFAAGAFTHRRLARPIPPPAPDAIWAPFLSPGPDPTLVIYSNPVFLGSPATGLHLASTDTRLPETHTAANLPVDDTYTGTGEAAAIFELTRLFDAHAAAFILKRSRLVTWDEAKSRNLIFVGAPSQNTALRDLPAGTEFSIALDPTGHGYILNHHPRPGEPLRFPAADPTQETALLALLPGLRPDRHILVFSGLTTIGTGALVEYLCRPENTARLLAADGTPTGPFEAVFQIDLSHNEAINARLLTLHHR